MDFIDKIEELSIRAPKQLDYCTTEEATKNALVLPFIAALGYDVFNPAEVMPEMTADFGIKKGEKVDYTIFQNNKPVILFECKKAKTDLGKVHASQLYRYFSVLPDVRFGVLTNGTEYRFLSDLDKPNVMDEKPFFIFDLLDYQERHVIELKKFAKSVFDLNEILATASDLKYTAAIQRIISSEFESPSDDFVIYLTKKVYSGRLTHTIKEQFNELTLKALRRFMNEQVNARLQSALQANSLTEPTNINMVKTGLNESSVQGNDSDTDLSTDAMQPEIVTTEEEIEGYFAIKSILRNIIDVTRIHIRDQKSYCNILLDNNNRKPICRLRFNSTQHYIGLFDKNKQEERIPIEDIDEIYDYAERLISTVKSYNDQFPIPEKTIEDGTRDTDDFTGKKPSAVVIFNNRYKVDTWKEAWFAVIKALRARDEKHFDAVAPTFRGRVRPYFSISASDLRNAERVPGSNLFVETNLGSWGIARLSKRLSRILGYDSSDLEFIVE